MKRTRKPVVLIAEDDGTFTCPRCDTVIYPTEECCGCGAEKPNTLAKAMKDYLT